MSNLRLAEDVLRSCVVAGVSEFVLCAGARNAPLVSILSLASGVKTYSFFEERSAAFFALGRIQATGRPVAVVTTSGTAAAELLPAAIEADYQGLPLILLTADRPKRYRGSGAPQTIVQPGLFSHYVEKSFDIENEWPGSLEISGRRPVHINVCFDEPILDGRKFSELEQSGRIPFSPGEFKTGSPQNLGAPIRIDLRSPLVILGGLPMNEAGFVKEAVKKWGLPVYAEAPSQLRGQFGEMEIREISIRDLDFDGVIRIGSVPTLRLWRDLEDSDKPVYHFSHLPYSGLSRSKTVYALSALAECRFDRVSPEFIQGAADTHRPQKLSAVIERFPLSEPGWVNWLSRQIPVESRVFLGNSLPIREWDLAADRERAQKIFVNRGANGIDGLISTFVGLAEAEASNWALLGDLSALYDLSGPWALNQRPGLKDLNIVVINNGGGKIFQRVFHNPLFENRHTLNFADWAKMWDMDYLRLEKPVALTRAQRPRVIEIIPQEEQTEKFWKEWR